MCIGICHSLGLYLCALFSALLAQVFTHRMHQILRNFLAFALCISLSSTCFRSFNMTGVSCRISKFRRKKQGTVIVCHMTSIVSLLVMDSATSLREGNVIRKRRELWEATSGLNELGFKRAFRLSRALIKDLVDMAPMDLMCDGEIARCGSGGAVQPEMSVAILFGVLAGASYLDLMLLFHISGSTVYRCFPSFLTLLNRKIKMDGFLCEQWQPEQLSKGFSASMSPPSPLHGCAGDFDGVAVNIANPKDPESPAHFYS